MWTLWTVREMNIVKGVGVKLNIDRLNRLNTLQLSEGATNIQWCNPKIPQQQDRRQSAGLNTSIFLNEQFLSLIPVRKGRAKRGRRLSIAGLMSGAILSAVFLSSLNTRAIAQSESTSEWASELTHYLTQTTPAERPSTPPPSSPGNRPLLQSGDVGPDVTEVQAMLRLMGFYSGAVNGQFEESTTIAVSRFQQAAGLIVDGIVGPSTWSRLLPSPASENSPSSPETAPETTSATESTPTPQPTSPSESTATVPSNPSPSSTPSTPASTPSSSDQETSSSAPAQSAVSLPVLRRGMRGPAVMALQERLRAIGVFSGAVDGVFGPQTEEAVLAAQRRFDLSTDGVVGPSTWSALLR